MFVGISIAQVRSKIGDPLYNAEKIIEHYERQDSHIIVFSELFLTGYSSQDLLLSRFFVDLSQKVLENIVHRTGQKVLIFGAPVLRDGSLYNAAIAAQNGKIIGISYKNCLPNYHVFSESRYFNAGKSGTFEAFGVIFGMAICEDIWHSEVCNDLKNQGSQIIVSINASPFDIMKQKKREEVVQLRFAECGIPFVYCNQIANNDGILYDGSSFFYDGKNIVRTKSFEESIFKATFDGLYFIGKSDKKNDKELYNSLVFGLREYVQNNKLSKVIIGLSGGADSALVAKIACDAIGRDNVFCYGLKTKFTSVESISDAENLVRNLGVNFEIIDIEPICQKFISLLGLQGIATENIQARVRGNILMAFSNKIGGIVLTTGNKSEIATGYCTLYGDMCGGYNPIKDIYKTQVWQIMKEINAENFVFPENIITKAPTAELRDGQKDSDSLPQYEILDEILFELIENGKRPEEIKTHNILLVEKIYNLIKASEYKRAQGAIGTKISSKSFEKSDWRHNITN